MSLPKAIDQSTALLPLAQALRLTPCHTDAGVRLALAQQAARSLIGALRHVCRSPGGSTPDEAPSRIAERMRQNFCDISPLAPQALARAYLLRGWWLRRHRFLRWYGMRPKP